MAETISESNEKFQKSINQFFLTFKNKDINKQYMNNFSNLQVALYRQIGFLLTLLYMAQFFNQIFDPAKIWLAVAAAVFCGVQILFLVISKKHPVAINLNIYISQIYNIMYFVEIGYFNLQDNHEESQQDLGKRYQSLGAGFIFLIFLWQFLIPHWTLRSLYLAIPIEYYIFRVYGILGLMQVSFHFSVLLAMPITYYRMDKYIKQNFFELNYRNRKLQETNKLVVKAISSSIFVSVFDNDKFNCIFINGNCKQEFQMKEKEEIFDHIQKFQIINAKKDDIKETKLIEIIKKQFNKYKRCNTSQNANKVEIQLDCQYDFQTDLEAIVQTRYYFVKIIVCMWEDQTAVMTVLDNTTEHLQNTRLKKLDQYKDNLLASVSHDLKTPANCIISFSQNAIQSNNLNDIKKSMQIINKNAYLQKYLINDILDFCQYKNLKLKVSVDMFKLSDVINEVLDIFKDIASAKGIQLQAQLLFSKANDYMMSDSSRVKQILINLVSNAIKYTIKGSITVSAEFVMQASQSVGDFFKISVKDTGVGIPMDISCQLFKKYATLNQSSNQLNNDGIGFGLVVCKKLVKLLGPYKNITVESVEKEGSTFTFYLHQKFRNSMQYTDFAAQSSQDNCQNEESDVILCQNQIIMQEKTLLDDNSLKLQNYKTLSKLNNQPQQIELVIQEQYNILIVDDNIYNIMTLKNLLNKHKNIKVYQTYSGEEALNKFMKMHNNQNSKGFKFIFIEQNMPIMSGPELIKQIRENEKLFNMEQSIIILLQTENFDSQNLQQQCGANHSIGKPISESVIKSLLTQYK